MKRILLSSCLMLSLSGCGSSDFSDLQAYMDAVSYTHLTLPTTPYV